MNTTSRRKKKQHFSYLNPMPVFENLAEFMDWVKNLPTVKRAILDRFFHLYVKYQDIFPDQGKIAKSIGCRREYVNIVLAEFEAMGLLVMQYRHRTTDLYRFSSFFKLFKVREFLRHYFKAFLYIPIACLQVEFTQVTVKEDLSFSLFRNTRLTVGVREEKNWQTLFKKEIVMEAQKTLDIESFTQQELEQLAEFSYDTIQFALISYRENQDHVKYPFEYLIGVCKKRTQKQEKIDAIVLPPADPREDIGDYSAPIKQPNKQWNNKDQQEERRKPLTADQHHNQRLVAEKRYRQAELPLLERIKIENRAKQAAWAATRNLNEVSS